MSLLRGMQIYEMQFRPDKREHFESGRGKEDINNLEKLGLVVKMWITKNRRDVLIRVYNPTKAVSHGQREKIDAFYYSNGGFFCGEGFLSEVAEIDPNKADLIYETRVECEAQHPSREIDSSSSSVEIYVAFLAAELNTLFKPTGEQLHPMQVEAAIDNARRVTELRKSNKGKFKVLWVDQYDHSDGVAGEFDTREEAIRFAETHTTEAKKHCTGKGIATMYYAYDPDGKYIGGDTWQEGEKWGLSKTDK